MDTRHLNKKHKQENCLERTCLSKATGEGMTHRALGDTCACEHGPLGMWESPSRESSRTAREPR